MNDTYTEETVKGGGMEKKTETPHPFNERGCYRCGRRDRLHRYKIGTAEEPPQDVGPLRGVTLCDPCYQSSNHGFWYRTELHRIW